MSFIGSAAPALRSSRSSVARFATKDKATEETFGKLADVVAEQLGVDKETVMALEESFDVELPDDETTSLKNVQDVADLIQSKLRAGQRINSMTAMTAMLSTYQGSLR